MFPPPSSPMQAPSGSSAPSMGGPAQSLVGPSQGDPSAPQPQVAPSPEQLSQAFMAQIRELCMGITSLARNFPAAAQDFELANQNLINGMTKQVISQSNTESASAPTLVG